VQKLLFNTFQLSEEIHRALADMGFEEATPIQSLTIPAAMAGRDLIGQAQTGTGKTAAFGIPILEKIDTRSKRTQALVLCPTRELAIQVSEEIRRLAAYKRGLSIVPVYGGQPIERQLAAFRSGAQVVVGTPGRVMDHLQRKSLRLDTLQIIVLDEADEMLDMGFIEDIESILESVPADRQTLLFSATMPKPILNITKKYQREPVHLSVVHEKLTVPLVEQSYLEVREHQKLEALSRLLDLVNPKLALVFCNTKKGVDDLVASLGSRGYRCEALHGDLKQVQRDRVMKRFRKAEIDILVATDVAARGLDVEEIEAVFNFDVPWDEEDYLHRIGRTARAGKSGRAFTFVSGRDFRKLRDIQRFTGTQIKREFIPSLIDVEESRATLFLEKVRVRLAKGVSERHLGLAERLTNDDVPSIEVAAALIGLALGDEERLEDRSDRDLFQRNDTGEMVTLALTVGRLHGVTPGDIVGAIAGEAGISGKSIGWIRIRDQETLVSVPAGHSELIISVMKKTRIRGQPLQVRETDEVDDRKPGREKFKTKRKTEKPPFRKKSAGRELKKLPRQRLRAT